MKKILSVGAVLLFAATASSAEVYECEMKRGASGGWISPLIIVGVDSAEQQAVVMDVFTQQLTEDWYPAKLSLDNKKRYTVTWSTGRQKDRSGQVTPGFDMRLNIMKSSKVARASSQPKGYEDVFSTTGKCKLIEG